jgi:hypothetical protein
MRHWLSARLLLKISVSQSSLPVTRGPRSAWGDISLNKRALDNLILTLGLILIVLVGQSRAATYFVRSGGTGTNCTQYQTVGTASRTIQAAINCTSTGGDVVDIGPGVFHERVIVPAGGSVGNPIIVRGASDSAGVLLTTVDGTSAITGTWQLANDTQPVDACGGYYAGTATLAGSGTYRINTPSSEPWHIQEGTGKKLLRISNRWMNGTREYNNYCRSGFEFLNKPSNFVDPVDWGVNYWDGIDALFGYSSATGYTYVRYRDGANPNTKNLRWAPGGEWEMNSSSVFEINGKSNITISNLIIQGSLNGVLIRGGGQQGEGTTANNNTVKGCTIRNFEYGVLIYGRSDNTKVLSCDLRSGLLGMTGFQPVAWQPVSTISTEDVYPYNRLVSWHMYAMLKFMNDLSYSLRHPGVAIHPGYNAGVSVEPTNIEIGYNEMTELNYGVDMFGGDGIDIHHNSVHNNVDIAFQRDSSFTGARNIQIHDNDVWEQKYTLFRWHSANQFAGNNYIYRNRVSALDKVGTHCFLPSDWSIGPQASSLNIWFYNNSFSGGVAVWELSGITSMPGFRAVNNVISHIGTTSISSGWPSTMGSFDYNSMSATLGAGGSWYGGNNTTGMPAIWSTSQIEKPFALPPGHPSRDSAVDVGRVFAAAGTQYNALPGMTLPGPFPRYYLTTQPNRGWLPWLPFRMGGLIGAGF